MKQITFYLDFISPYAYLAFEKLPEALQGFSYAVEYKPLLSPRLWGSGHLHIRPHQKAGFVPLTRPIEA